jgi:hypothetical protein
VCALTARLRTENVCALVAWPPTEKVCALAAWPRTEKCLHLQLDHVHKSVCTRSLITHLVSSPSIGSALRSSTAGRLMLLMPFWFFLSTNMLKTTYEETEYKPFVRVLQCHCHCFTTDPSNSCSTRINLDMCIPEHRQPAIQMFAYAIR